MPLSRSRDYLSIGEVLEAIKPDFPDISISKIRFLESEGLISPERTGSGYRKFFEGDLQRIRYILTLQRDQFLPLKVIRERLASVDANGGAPPETGAAAAASPPAGGPKADAVSPAAPPPPALSGVSLSRDELRTAAGLGEAEFKGLEEFGIVRGDNGTFDEFDLMICKASAKLFHYGIEPRHLRMYRQFADREASFFEQIVGPVAGRRDPEGQKEAARSVDELIGLGRQMREGVLRGALRESL